MEVLSGLPSWGNIAVAVTVYFAGLAIYRLFMHPLSGFPGLKLATITECYETYYEMIQRGQYIFKIAEMNKNYALALISCSAQDPIIPIDPYELHVNDPSFFEKLYRQDGCWDKYAWAQDASMVKGAVLRTPDHDLHKVRRLPLNPFFSKAKVGGKQDLIRHNVSKLCSRISKATAIYLGAATGAFTRNVSTQFILDNEAPVQDDDGFRTIVHEIVDSKFLPTEKAFGRVVDDVMTVAGVGFETTAKVLRLVFYHVFSNASIIQRLRAELASDRGLSQSSGQVEFELRTLKQLPYLTSILMEGMRLSPAIVSRMTRIAGDGSEVPVSGDPVVSQPVAGEANTRHRWTGGLSHENWQPEE